MRHIISFLLIVLVAHFAWTQQCGTIVTEKNLAFLETAGMTRAYSNSGSLSTSSGLVKIPIKFHALKNSAGEGGMTETEKDELMVQMNNYFANSNIELVHQGDVNEIIDDNNYDFDSENEGAVAVANDVSKTINVYFSNSITSNGVGICGYTRFPPSSDRVFVAYDCINGGTTEHEIGHYFTLYHTHGTTNTGTTDELADGSNCATAGDRICDTPADPNLSGNVSPSCTYTGTAKDVNGQSYTPDPTNIMSYSPGPCRERFTIGQYDRMRRGFENGRAYLDFTVEGFAAVITSDFNEQCIGNEIRFKAIAFGASSYEWEFEGGNPPTSSLINPIVEYNQGGEFDVTLKVTDNAGQEILVEKSNFITIDDPLKNTLDKEFSSQIVNDLPVELFVDNPDLGFTFEYSQVDADESSTSGSIFINNYAYYTENLLNIDKLFLRNYSTEGIKNITVSFDYAYTYLPIDRTQANPLPARYDSLTLRIRSQCGTKGQILWHVGGDDLRTTTPTTEPFVPTSNQWLSKTFTLEVAEELDYIGIEFVSHSYNGNNLYIDNLVVTPDFTVDPPIDFRLSKVENGVPTLRWFDGSNNETAYVIERSVNESNFEELARLDPNTILYRDATLQQGNDYSYRLYADGVQGNRSSSSQVVKVSSSSITGILSTQNNIVIYPNPFEDYIWISQSGQMGYLEFKLLDLSGKLIQYGTISSGKPIVVDNSTKSGVYVLHLFNDKISRRIKILK